ncbi:MAG TPA: hypothetical protein VE397_17105 [Stellaceae bacterium]|jgi:hypothetical protein|nr:hypothetical protein [Stellaceae bacterium]
MKPLPGLVALALLLLPALAEAREVKEFDFEAAAQKHCPKDEVVWSNVKGGGIYHRKGTQLYGNTTDGGYLCRKEADAAGWHEYANDHPKDGASAPK